jgi:hypothetical protein
MLNKFISLALLTVSLGSLVSCGSKVEDRPVAMNNPATTGAMTTTSNNKLATAGTGTIVAPAGITIETDLQQELSTGKNLNNDKFTAKIRNGFVGKYPALKDAVVEGHLENVSKATKGKKATFNLFFDAIKLKNGDLLPIDATLVNTQVESKTKGQFLKNTGIILGGAVAGHFAGKQADFKNGAAAGAAAATAFVLSSPGGEVVLKKGTDLQLKLKSNLTN